MWLSLNMAEDPKIPSGKIEVKSRVMKEMLKPIVFGNHQKQFKIFTFVVCSGINEYKQIL